MVSKCQSTFCDPDTIRLSLAAAHNSMRMKDSLFHLKSQPHNPAQKRRLLVGLLAVTFLGWTSLCSALWAIEPPKQRAMTNDSRSDMITVLEAATPHSSIGEQAHVFDQFIGTWTCDYANFAEDGTTTRGKGEVMFGWILDGHAVQDVWTWTAEGASGQRELVTDIRFFDSKSGKWRAVWVDPTSFLVRTASGGVVGDRIVLESTANDGSLDQKEIIKSLVLLPWAIFAGNKNL